MPSTSDPRITRAGWGESVLSVQRKLLARYADEESFSYSERPVPLSSGRVINVVVAKPVTTSGKSVLCLVHGWGSGLATFSESIPHLVSTFRAIYLIDLPGMGASSRQRFRCKSVEDTLNYFIHDLDEMFLALSLGDETFRDAKHRVLGCHSLGAYISVEWMLRKPRFDKLILISPVGVPPRPKKVEMPESQFEKALFLFVLALWSVNKVPQEVLHVLPRPLVRSAYRRILPWSRREKSDLDKLALLVEYNTTMSKAPVAGDRAGLTLLLPGTFAVVPMAERLPLLTLPVTFVYGEYDYMDWRAGERARQDLSVPSRLEIVPDAEHVIFGDNPEGFSEVVVQAVRDFEDGVF